MSKWKTSKRKSRKLGNSDSSGNLSLHSYADPADPGSDGSSLSFLDDMLATAEKNRSGNATRVPPPSQQAQGEIDDILDLVGSQHSGGSRRRGSGSSNLSGLSQRGKERRDLGSEPASPYAPRSGNNFPYTPQSGNRTYQRHGGSSGVGGRRSPGPSSRNNSQEDPPSRPSMEQPSSRYLSDDHRKHQPTRDAKTFQHSSNTSEQFDDHTPIPVFSVNAGREDDDSISCITSSVTSHYDHESRSGSFPWSRGRKSGASHGESSYSDTLDEIADMLHPNQNGRTSVLTPRNSSHNTDHRRPRSPGKATMSGGGDEFFRPPVKADDIFGSNNKVKGSSNAPPLSADEIYRSSRKANARPSNQHGTSILVHCEPLLSQTRLLFRYWLSLIFPRGWRRKGGKDEEGQGYLGTWNNSSVSSNPRKIPRSKQRFQFWKAVLLSVCGFFLVMTVVILLVRLALMHGPKLKPAVAKIRGGMKRLRKSAANANPARAAHDDADLTDKDVHGGMAHRREGGSTTTSGDAVVAGGMAKYSLNEAEEDPLDKIQVYGHGDHVGIELPAAFNNLADVKDLPVRKGVDIPLFWHIPRTGGGTVNDIFGGCLGLTLAADAGASGAAGKENKLQVVKFSKHFSYVNVDTSTPAGIERAKRLDLASSGLADVVVSTLLYQASSLFSPQHKGRLFTIIRHPVERAVSLFHYVQDTQWRRRQTFQKELSELTIDEYFESGLAENNWMTRYLINEPTKGELTRTDVKLAKEILRKKCLVGLLSDKGESFARFERFFGFPLKDDEQKDCHEKKLQWAWPLKHRHEEVEENTPLWDLIITHNVYDMELYNYASEVIFTEQAKIFQ